MKRFLTALASLAVPSLIWAVPADPRPRTLTNPDGTTIQVRMHGDEHFHFMTDVDCTSILQRDASGFIVNAMRNGAPIMFNRENVEMLRAEKELESPENNMSASRSIQRMAALDSDGRSNYPTVGDGIRSLVVLVEFQDVQFTVENPKEYYTRQLNEPGFSDYGGRGSALDYYKAASHGLYTPQFDVYGPVKISKNTTYFADEDNKTKNMNLLIHEALTTLHDNGELDLSNYDYDKDGTLDTVFIYYAGYGSADSDTQTIWPHQSSYWGSTFRLDGVKVGPFACANELDGYNPQTRKQPWKDGSEPWVGGIGTFVHEYGHVLGLPDLYDVQYSDNVVTPGEWDVMDNGSYNFNGVCPPLFSAYEQWLCRWLEYTDAEDATNYNLKALGNTDEPSAVRIPILNGTSGSSYASEYFVIESRDNSKWDECFPKPGLMIWRINYKRSIWAGNSVNSINGSNVEIVYAFDAKNPLYSDGNFIVPGTSSELIPEGSYSRWNCPIISSMSYDSQSMTGSFDYNVITDIPVGSSVLHDQPYADKSTSNCFYLEWDSVEDADSYLVTIKRSSNGRILGSYEEYNVGKVNKLKVTSVPIAFWNNELEAYIRVVKVIPCSDTSNVIKFIPKNLPKGKQEDNAVDGIEDEMELIYGGDGCIIAPEGAVIYNMSGQQLRNENLVPGIYLVCYGSRTAKVLVH